MVTKTQIIGGGAIFVLVLIGLLGVALFGLQNVIRGDDFITFDDFEVPHPELIAAGADDFKSGFCTQNFVEITHVSTTCKGETYETSEGRGGFGARGSVGQNVNAGYMSLGGSNGASANVRTVKDFSGFDVKIIGSAGGKNGCSGVGANGCGVSICSTNQRRDFVVEILSSRIGNECEAFLNGQFHSSGVTTPGFNPISIGDSNAGNDNDHNTRITEIKFKVPFNCRIDPGQFLVYEPISGEKEISIFDMTFDVNKFCLDHPVVVFQEDVGSTTTAEPYSRWVRGDTLLIPDGQIWGVFYIAQGEQGCSTNEAFNTEAGQCISGVVTACNGFLDVVTGSCVTLASLETKIAVLNNQIKDLIRQIEISDAELGIVRTDAERLREAIRLKELDLVRLDLSDKEQAALVDILGGTLAEKEAAFDELQKTLKLGDAEVERLSIEIIQRDLELERIAARERGSPEPTAPDIISTEGDEGIPTLLLTVVFTLLFFIVIISVGLFFLARKGVK